MLKYTNIIKLFNSILITVDNVRHLQKFTWIKVYDNDIQYLIRKVINIL